MCVGTSLFRQLSLVFPLVDNDQELLVCHEILPNLVKLALVGSFDEVFLLDDCRFKTSA